MRYEIKWEIGLAVFFIPFFTSVIDNDTMMLCLSLAHDTADGVILESCVRVEK